MSITHSECVSVTLVIQHAMRLRHIVLCGLSVCLSGSTIFFSTLSHKRRELLNKIIEHTMCFDILYKFCLKYSYSNGNSERFYRKRTYVFM